MVDIKQMKNPSVVLQKVGEILFEDRPIPKLLDPNYVKVLITNTGLCGSDVHYYEFGNCGSFKVEKPMVLGHESSGVIVEIGDNVVDLKIGDRVSCEPGIPSRYSPEFKAGHYNLDPKIAFAATPPYDGTLCKYYLLPKDFVYKLPEHISLEEGALVEPLSVAVHVNRLLDIKVGDSAIIFGAGPIGVLCAGVAKAFGCHTILMVDIIEKRLNFALNNCYATHVFNSKNKSFEDLQNTINSIWSSNDQMPTCGIDATGNKWCTNMCLRSLSKRGRFVQVGMSSNNFDSFPISTVVENELTVKGSFRYSVGDYKIAIQLLSDEKIKVKPLITHRFDFEDAIKAYEFAKLGKSIKIMIKGPQSKF